MKDFSNFECDNCGACCRSLIVEAQHYDAKREPRLVQLVGEEQAKSSFGFTLYDTVRKCCPFLTDENKCDIYPTRPVVCVLVEPGDAKCQQARLTSRLPLLGDTDGNQPTRYLLEWSCNHYDLDVSEVGLD